MAIGFWVLLADFSISLIVTSLSSTSHWPGRAHSRTDKYDNQYWLIQVWWLKTRSTLELSEDKLSTLRQKMREKVCPKAKYRACLLTITAKSPLVQVTRSVKWLRMCIRSARNSIQPKRMWTGRGGSPLPPEDEPLALLEGVSGKIKSSWYSRL